MKKRIIAAAVALPVFLIVLLVLPQLATAILFAAISVVAVWELMCVTGLVRHLRLFIYSAIMAAAVSIWSFLGCPHGLAVLLLLAYFTALAVELLSAHTALKFSKVCIAAFSAIVMPLFLSAMVRLQMMENGRFLVLVPCIIAFTADSGAYFIGRAFGNHKLAPIISPKKTVEGAVGGAACAVLGMIIYALILRFGFGFSVNYLYAAIYGLFGAVGSIIGDLFYSCVKRQVKIKDYGNILPGHGGVLDRFDSMSVVAPLVEAFMLLIPFAARAS